MTAPGGLIIFGATGDLARRMLFPSLYFLDLDGMLPEGLRIVGAARIAAAHAHHRDRTGRAQGRILVTQRTYLNRCAPQRLDVLVLL